MNKDIIIIEVFRSKSAFQATTDNTKKVDMDAER